MKNIHRTLISIFFFASLSAHSAEVALTSVESGTRLEDLVKDADIVVAGEISGIANEFILFGYDENGNLKSKPDPRDGFPAIDFSIEVQEVIYDPRSLYRGDDLVYRSMGDTSWPSFTEVYDMRKGFSVFFLSLNPDGKTFGVRDSRHMINLKFDNAHFMSGRKMENLLVPGEGQGNLREIYSRNFVDEVYDAVENVSK
ncbi:MAG: hypothetical protein RQ899_13490 [Pseudomonadales bacterium]|nr:hypothetical protein [Pseudomonadales bacterium]